VREVRPGQQVQLVDRQWLSGLMGGDPLFELGDVASLLLDEFRGQRLFAAEERLGRLSTRRRPAAAHQLKGIRQSRARSVGEATHVRCLG